MNAVTNRPDFSPALEGVRGMAILAVLLFHGQVLGATGGFLGVSLFFSLSGFLVSQRALIEISSTGVFNWRNFLRRRSNRILPIAAVGTTFSVATTLALANPKLEERMLGEALATLFQVINWRFILEERSYSDLFEAPSAFAHYWSLSLEVQFYLILLVLLVMISRGTRPGSNWLRMSAPRRTVVLGSVGWLISLIFQLLVSTPETFVYYSTISRCGEFFIGMALAGLVAQDLERWSESRSLEILVGAFGLVALAVVVVPWFLVDSSSPILGRGGFGIYGLGSTTLLVGGLLSKGLVHRICVLRPLRFLGRVSFSLYVLHWPIFLLLDEFLDELSNWVLFLVKASSTVLFSLVSYLHIERRAQFRSARGLISISFSGAILVAACGAMLAQRDVAVQTRSFEEQEELLEQERWRLSSGDDRIRIVSFGDSTAFGTVGGVAKVLTSRGVVAAGGGDVELGCGLNRVVRTRRAGTIRVVPLRCDWSRRATALVNQTMPDLVLVSYGPWEMEDQQINENSSFEHLGDASFDDFVRGEITELIELLVERGTKVIWIDVPSAGKEFFKKSITDLDFSQYERRRIRFNQILYGVATNFRGSLGVVRLSSWLDNQRDDEILRPDGVHFSDSGSFIVAKEWLADQVVAVARSLNLTI